MLSFPLGDSSVPCSHGVAAPYLKNQQKQSRGQSAPTDFSNQVSANFSNDRMDFSQFFFLQLKWVSI